MGSCLIITLFAGICFTLTGNLIGLTGYSWWKSAPYDHGLWRYCRTLPGNRGKIFYIRSDLFNSHREYFVATVLLGVSCGFIAASAIATVLSYFYRNEIKIKIINELASTFFIFVAAALGWSALIYIEVKLEDQFNNMDRGWSNIFCLLGYIASIEVLIQSIIMAVGSIKSTTSTTGTIVQVECYEGEGNESHNKPQVKFLL